MPLQGYTSGGEYIINLRAPPCPYSGFPPGYIAGLEKRLLETELALFDTLILLSRCEGVQHSPRQRDNGSQFLSGHTSTISGELLASHATHQAKLSSLEEWAQLPLASEAQRLGWFEKKRADLETLVFGKPLSDTSMSQQQQQPQFLPSAGVISARLERMSSSGSPAIGTVDSSPPHQPQTPSQERLQGVGQQQGSASPTTEGTSQAQRLSSTQWRRFF